MAKNEITRYDVELNTIPLGILNSAEMNLFFAIVTKMKDKGDKVVRFHFDELRDLSDFSSRSSKRFLSTIRDTYKKLLTLNFGYRSKTGVREEYFVIFNEFTIDQDEDGYYVDVQVYEKAIPILNDLTSWVRYSLKEFNSLKSSYAKTLFRLLKQFRTTGFYKVKKEEFHELMAVPKSYRQGQINKNILTPCLDQLLPYFKDLKVEKEFSKKQGRALKNYIFKFTPEAKDKDDFQEKKNVRRKPVKSREIATNWSQKQSKSKVDNKSLDDLLGQIDETKEEVKS
ncbi:replication initiation protein [Holzapfeliella sp. JNUCC 80]